jgi:hypothetical protein
MIAECSESDHDTQFIGKSWCVLFFIADIYQQGGDKEDVNQIDPGMGGMLANADNILIEVIDHNKKAKTQNRRKGPIGHLVLEEGNHKEEGGNKENVK